MRKWKDKVIEWEHTEEKTSKNGNGAVVRHYLYTDGTGETIMVADFSGTGKKFIQPNNNEGPSEDRIRRDQEEDYKKMMELTDATNQMIPK